MSTTFENAQVGDKVWSIRFGYGTVVSTCDDSIYPLVIEFIKYPNLQSYTLEGQEFNDELQTLFWKEIKFEAPKQPPRMKLINGIEVPDISFQPEYAEYYYYPSLEPDLCNSLPFQNHNKTTVFHAVNNFCYPFTPEGKEAAILHTKALLGVK
jgi:hypothetical protein